MQRAPTITVLGSLHSSAASLFVQIQLAFLGRDLHSEVDSDRSITQRNA